MAFDPVKAFKGITIDAFRSGELDANGAVITALHFF